MAAPQGSPTLESSSDGPQPRPVAESVYTNSYYSFGCGIKQQWRNKGGYPNSSDPLSTWRSPLESLGAGVHSSTHKSSRIRIKVSHPVIVNSSDSRVSPKASGGKASSEKVFGLRNSQGEIVGRKGKRHVRAGNPDSAYCFVTDLIKKPPFQPTIRSWPALPICQRDKELRAISRRAAHSRRQSTHWTGPKRVSLTCGTLGNMSISESFQSNPEAMRNGHAGSFASSAASSSHGGIPSSTAQPTDGGGPTKLTGLACDVHRTTGKKPCALVGATTTILGDKLYVFGGRTLSQWPHLKSDLYELDLIKRHWTKLETSGEVPPPRYFHSVCALGDTKLVCYGGMASASYSKSPVTPSPDSQPEYDVMKDIHIYDVPSRTWMSIKTSETPQGRYAHCATILPSSATFTSPTAPLSAIQHNPSSSNPHSGSIGLKVDGTGGAEMVVVGGQDNSNHYIEEINVFNLRSLKWTATNSLGRQCGAYRSVVTPLTGMSATSIGSGAKNAGDVDENGPETGSSMLIYSNYKFLDVKLELQIRQPDGRLSGRSMNGTVSPPGLRFPNGGIIDHHFVVSGTHLTSPKQEYALWALDLRDLTWGRVDPGGAIFGHGSWNRGILWNRRNTFVILGNRKRSLLEDYNQRRINFRHICMVELEAFGLYDNPRKAEPWSGYRSMSSPSVPASLWPKVASQAYPGQLSTAAESLGHMALGLKEVADMDFLAIGGERIPVNSYLLRRRWGPYFNRLLHESCAGPGRVSDAISLRPHMNSQASRSSAATITPSLGNTSASSGAATLINSRSSTTSSSITTTNAQRHLSAFDAPDLSLAPPSERPRTLYLPHASQTIRLMLHYLYTNSLPSASSHLCAPQILCSVLQLARPYEIDGLLEATVERLHEVLDGRNAAAVLNASAMAAGGGGGLGAIAGFSHGRRLSEADTIDGMGERPDCNTPGRTLSARTAGLKIDTSVGEMNSNPNLPRVRRQGHERSRSEESAASTSTAASAATSTNDGDLQSETQRQSQGNEEIWTGDVSAVIGLQKRGLRGLMEERMLRERGRTVSNPSFNAT